MIGNCMPSNTPFCNFFRLLSTGEGGGGGGGGRECFPCKTFSMSKKSKTVKVIILKLGEFL